MSLRLRQRVTGGGDGGDEPDAAVGGGDAPDGDGGLADWRPFRLTGTSTALSDGEIYDVLRNSRRRAALSYLLEQGRASVREVTTHVAATEYDVAPEAISPEQRKRVYTALSQCHLPRLDEYGVVDFDEDAKAIELDDVPGPVATYLQGGDGTDADRVELAVAWTVATLAILGVLGVDPFGRVPIVAWALLTVAGLSGVALRQLYAAHGY